MLMFFGIRNRLQLLTFTLKPLFEPFWPRSCWSVGVSDSQRGPYLALRGQGPTRLSDGRM